MRIRQVKPEFWRDATIADLTPVTRLTYIGLWMLADDAGWFRLDVPSIALELYGWEARRYRERTVATAIESLTSTGRIVQLECIHAHIPTLTDHQRFGGETKRVYTVKKEHDRCSPLIPADTRESPRIPDPVRNGRGSGNGSVSKGTSNARKREEDEAPSEFQLRVPRLIS